MDTAIELKEVFVVSGDVEILKNISVNFPKNKSTVILGHSGCGKSTLLKTAAGIQPIESGEVLLEDTDFMKMTEKKYLEFRKKNGFVFQDAALWDNTSVFNNLSLPLEFHYRELSKKEIESMVNKFLVKTGLKGQEYLRPAQLSMGEKKIISFLRAVIVKPKFLFMDEPTQSIDSKVVDDISGIIRELRELGCTIITVSHDPQITSWLADYIVILRHGELVAAGELNEIAETKDEYVKSIVSGILKDAAPFNENLLDLLDQQNNEE
jgi:phospholipid/cholesterol/gamma-HCH transport system ATP-binding protein